MSETPIDFQHLSRQTDGDRDLENELLALFAEQCLLHLRTIAGEGAAVTRRDAAHTLRGAAQAVGAWQVAEAAATVEGQLATAPVTTAAALAALGRAIDAAHAAIMHRDSGG